MRKKSLFVTFLMTCSVIMIAPVLSAKETTNEVKTIKTEAQLETEYEEFKAKFNKTLHPQTGQIKIPAAKASLQLGEDYFFLPADEAKRVLIEAWGNSPGAAEGVLGIIFPKGATVFDSWGAVVEFQDIGYVSDADAQSQDYAKVLKQLQDAQELANKEAQKSGYPSMQLVGWATAPTYDTNNKFMVWAKNIRIDDGGENSLNYDVRKLGRNGVLSVSMIARMSELEQVKAASIKLSQTLQFDTGARYADYVIGDKKSELGLAGLVAAGAGVAVAKKLGILGLLAAFAKKFFVLFAVAFAAVGNWLKKLFSKSHEEENGPD